MPIRIFNNQNKIKLNISEIRNYLPQIEKKMRLAKTSIYSVIFVDDKNIKKLNKDFRNTDRPTDVLSFLSDCSCQMAKNFQKNADIFISLETAKSNAKFYCQKFYTEILRLIIHGILHSMDYTDYSEKSKKIMWEKQEKILKCL